MCERNTKISQTHYSYCISYILDHFIRIILCEHCSYFKVIVMLKVMNQYIRTRLGKTV